MKQTMITLVLLAFVFSAFSQLEEKKTDVKKLEEKKVDVKQLKDKKIDIMNLEEKKLEVKEVQPNSGKALIEFTTDVHDFGDIDEGPKVTHEFTFTNAGTEPLILSNVKASCGCTVPKWPKEPIMPGDQSVIEVTYNTARRPGNFNKAVTITSNAQNATKVIYIKGKVIKAIEEETLPVKEKSILTPDGM